MAKKKRKVADDRPLLIQMLEEAYRLPNWNETSMRKSLARVSPEMAGWRPRGAKRSIADIVVHCAYWKYALRRRLTGARRGSFPFKGSNWFSTGKTISREQWSQYKTLLESEHDALCEAVRSYQHTFDHKKPRQDGHWTSIQRIFWLAIHDGYHTGQINLIKAMFRRSKQANLSPSS